MDEVDDLVGDNVLEGHLGGLDESPVDTDNIILAAGAPGVFGIGQAGCFGLDLEPFGVSSGKGLEVGMGPLFEPVFQGQPNQGVPLLLIRSREP